MDIASLELDFRSRDEIPQLLLGLPAIYKDRPTRQRVFEILEQIVPDCDSFVVETDVHYPTDINLLWDATRKIISLIAIECITFGITEWRQSDYILRKIKKAFNLARKLKRSNSKNERRRAIKGKRLPIVKRCFRYLKSIPNGSVKAKPVSFRNWD